MVLWGVMCWNYFLTRWGCQVRYHSACVAVYSLHAHQTIHPIPEDTAQKITLLITKLFLHLTD